MTDAPDDPPVHIRHPLEAGLAALVGLLLIGLTTGLLYLFASRWPVAASLLPDRTAEITVGSVAGFIGVLAFFYGLAGALQQRLWLAVGSPARGQPGGLAGKGAVAGGLGAALGGGLLVAAAGGLIVPDLALPVNAVAAGLAGVTALLLAWGVAVALRSLGY